MKFPVCIIAHECMRDKDIKFQTHQKIADVLAWSFKCAQSGLWPLVGPMGESFSSGDRKTYAGQTLAGGYKGCYFGFRADGKARKETNFFQRSYQHSSICESCLAQQEHKDWQPLLSYKDFYPTAAYRLTRISHLPKITKKTCLNPNLWFLVSQRSQLQPLPTCTLL